MTRTIRTIGALAACVLATAGTPAAAAPTTLDAKRREATRLQSQLQAHGRRLSIATEDYNTARLGRESVDLKVARARKELRLAEDRWLVLKQRLARRVRLLYMHPGIWAAPMLGASDINQLGRNRVLAASVLLTDSELLLRTEKARSEIVARKEELETVRVGARREETALAARRQQVEKELATVRTLLTRVNGEIATILEQERQRKLAEAAARAAAAKKTTSGGVPAPKNVGPVRPSASKAVSTAVAQIGKPYRWGADGPDAFDCSGLTMYAWSAAGVSLPHSSRAQYSSLPRVPNDQIEPGDLLFFGNPIHHVGIYEGGGVMVNAPETGETVRRSSIYRKDFVGAARP